MDFKFESNGAEILPPFCDARNQNGRRYHGDLSRYPGGSVYMSKAIENLVRNEEYTKKNGLKKKGIRSILRSILPCGIFEDFCNETSIHGFNHIVAPRRHFCEKLGWFVATALAVVGAVLLCLQQWVRYNASPTVVALEKDFRSWNNSFLALTSCQEIKYNSDLKDTIDKYWGVKEDDEKYGYYANFLKVIASSTLTNLDGFATYADDQTLKDVDIFQLALEIFPPGDEKLSWYEKGINVSFVSVMTELGICHTVNSVVSIDQLVKLPEAFNILPSKEIVSCKYTTHPCYLRVEYKSVAITYYSHSPYDLADLSSEKVVYLSPGTGVDVHWTALETKAAQDVRNLAVERRSCRYHEEPISERYQVYSGSICRRLCRNRIALKLCGCRPYFYFQEAGKACDPAGLACLAKRRLDLLKLTGCSCLPQCEDATYELVSQKTLNLTGPFKTQSVLKGFILPPRSRYRRQILFYFEDLVVSFGGAAGLFLGCSFLSGVEIIYFILKRTLYGLEYFFCKRHTEQKRKSNQSTDLSDTQDIGFVFRKKNDFTKTN